MLVNYKHQCTPTNYKKVQFFISPSKGIKDVEVCVLPVLRSATKYSNEDIMTLVSASRSPTPTDSTWRRSIWTRRSTWR